MTRARMDSELMRWTKSIDDLQVNDEALRLFAHLLRIYLDRGQEDQEGIESMASIITNPDADDDDVQAALDTLRESLHSTASAVDLESEDELTDEERSASRRMDSEEAAFAERLLAVMTEKNMSQVQLAAAIGVGQPAISMMLSRNCRPQRRTVERLARALEVSPEQLWPGFADRTEAAELEQRPTGEPVAPFTRVVGQTTPTPRRRSVEAPRNGNRDG